MFTSNDYTTAPYNVAPTTLTYAAKTTYYQLTKCPGQI
tara:strand:+ start:287 stop:400 length:114 start_codon:yes stop_codon:yes gene_type:complete